MAAALGGAVKGEFVLDRVGTLKAAQGNDGPITR